VKIANGEDVGVLTEVNLARVHAAAQDREVKAAREFNKQLGDALAAMLIERRPRSAHDAAIWLVSHYPTLFRSNKGGGVVSDTTLRRRLPIQIGKGIATSQGIVEVRGVGGGRGNAAVIDFRHHAEPDAGKAP
jgi:hypothetical protein